MRRNQQKAMAAALALVFVPAVLRAEDWPQWRGPNRDGVWRESGVLELFPAGGLKVRWKASVGPGWSSPIVSAGRVFVTDSLLVKPSAKERIHCFDETTGKPLWTYAYEVDYPEWALNPKYETGPTATAIAEAGKIFALGGNGHIHCLDARNGNLIWQRRLEKQYEIDVLRCRPSPLIDGNRLILLVGGKPGACVIALDKHSGKEVWKALDDSVSNSSPVIVEAAGKRQLIVWTGESVTALEPTTGKTWWRERVASTNNDNIPTPVHDQSFLLISGLMLKLHRDKPAASVLWPRTRAASRLILSNTSTGMIRDGHIYSARSSGHLVCLDANTGKQVWETDHVTDLKGGASIHLTQHGETVLLYTDRGELIRAKLDPKGYKEVSRARVLQPVYPFGGRKVAWSPPAFANGHIFARTERELVCASLMEKR
jgi:outer membrane protein assembly factor BamB